MLPATRPIVRALTIVCALVIAPVAAAALGPVAAPSAKRPLSWAEQTRAISDTVTTAAREAALREIERRRIEAERRRREAAEDARVAAIIQAQARRLRPGSYVWRTDRAPSGAVEIVVSLAAQRAYVFRAGKLIAVSTVSTGRPGYETPTGLFPILERKRRHYSNLYDGAPMPNMQRLTWDGVALHAGAIPAGPASHGCVRLPMAFSDLLFGITSRGSIVRIVANAPPSAVQALAFAAAEAGAGVATARLR